MVECMKSIGYGYARLANVGSAFGDMIRAARESQDIKSYRLAELIGRRPSLISRIENGDYKETPPPDIIARLSDALGIPQYAMLRSLGYDVGPTTDQASPPFDPEREALVDRLRRARLTPKRIRALEGVLGMFLDATGDDLVENGGRLGNSHGVT